MCSQKPDCDSKLSRFHIATILTGVTATAVCFLVSGSMRWEVLLAIAVAYVLLFAIGVTFIRLQFFGPVVCRGPVGEKLCALTFDDGPDPIATTRLMELLRREHVQATFFCVGARVLESPDTAAQIVADGHLLGNHSHRHSWWTNLLSPGALAEEILCAQSAIQTAAGMTPLYYRPPVGLTNPGTAIVMRRLKLICVGWSVRSLDRNSISVRRVVRRIQRGLREGGIVLLHDGGVDPHRLLTIVEQVITWARKEGYRFVRLDQLLDNVGASNASSRIATAEV